jgi:2-polyprenyl-3-methyl-5-hydroxy-6-metoxy-1,4-benzoquinol methylase
MGRWAPYRVCPSCGTGSIDVVGEEYWTPGARPSEEQHQFWGGRVAQWEATIGRPDRGRVLVDIGCAFGHFVAWANDAGWDAWGVEPSEWAREQSVADKSRIVSSLDEIPGAVDQFTLWDVLEHVDDPVGFLRSLAARSSTGGSILVSSPNFAALKVRWPWLRLNSERFNDVVRPSEHVLQFTTNGVRVALERGGFEDVRFLRPPASRSSFLVDAFIARVPVLRRGFFAVATRRG